MRGKMKEHGHARVAAVPQVRTDEIMIAFMGGTSGPPVAFPPNAAFTSDVTIGDTPLTVQFTDQSDGNPHTWAWGFGDTGSSTQQNPSHVYSDFGVYTVSLTATNDEGSDTETKVGYINATFIPDDVSQDDADKLRLFYLSNDTNGDNWPTNTGWADGPTPSSTVGTWHGVTVEGGRVTQIDLSSNVLYAPHVDAADIPRAVTWLSLSASNTNISGSFLDLPQDIELCGVHVTNSTISGDFADIPPLCRFAYFFNIPGGISSATGPFQGEAITDIIDIRGYGSITDVTVADGILDICYATRADWKSVQIKLRLDDIKPSGIYQSASPPTTPLEKAYWLENSEVTDWQITCIKS